MKPRIVTMAQLALLPIGTVFSAINLGPPEARMECDCQGWLQLHPQERITSIDDNWIHATGVLPGLKVDGGRLYDMPSDSSFARSSENPWRFVVWSVPE